MSMKARYQDHEPELIHPGAFPSIEAKMSLMKKHLLCSFVEDMLWCINIPFRQYDEAFFPSVWFIFAQRLMFLRHPLLASLPSVTAFQKFYLIQNSLLLSLFSHHIACLQKDKPCPGTLCMLPDH